MKTSVSYRVGPGMTSLLMVLVVLCMATLAILAFASTRVDTALTQRSLESTVQYYEGDADLQRLLASLDEQLIQARQSAQGDVQHYLEEVVALQSNEDLESYVLADGVELQVVAKIDEDRQLDALVYVPLTLEGPRYEVRQYSVVLYSEWESETSVGYYVPPTTE